jgi:hypothetical protein
LENIISLRIVLEERKLAMKERKANAGNAGKAFSADNKGFQSLQLYKET